MIREKLTNVVNEQGAREHTWRHIAIAIAEGGIGALMDDGTEGSIIVGKVGDVKDDDKKRHTSER